MNYHSKINSRMCCSLHMVPQVPQVPQDIQDVEIVGWTCSCVDLISGDISRPKGLSGMSGTTECPSVCVYELVPFEPRQDNLDKMTDLVIHMAHGLCRGGDS